MAWKVVVRIHAVVYRALFEGRVARLAAIGERVRGSFRRIDEATFRYRERFDVELYPATNPLDREAIARRVEVALFAASARLYPIVTVEDLLLIKIREYLKYPDAQHVDDARRLLVANRRGLNVEYLEERLGRVSDDGWVGEVGGGWVRVATCVRQGGTAHSGAGSADIWTLMAGAEPLRDNAVSTRSLARNHATDEEFLKLLAHLRTYIPIVRESAR